jgi:hypothetical protein
MVRGGLQVSHRASLGALGFWSCPPAAGGRRRLGAVDPNLIGRLWALHTLLASGAAYGRALPVGRFKRTLPRARVRNGPARCSPGLVRSVPKTFFSR